MARIREALRRADAMRGQQAVGSGDYGAKAGLRPFHPEEAPCPSEVEAEIPFIEVGGRETPMEASPSVLAAVPAKRGARSAERGVLIHGEGAARSALGARRSAHATPRAVVFRPFPPEPALLRPAEERFAPELVALHQPDHPLSEQYRLLVQNLEHESAAGQPRALLFLAPSSQIETSAVLLNLAITRARLGTIRTLVVDANLQRPVVAERLGLPLAPGLAEVLAGKHSVARATQETGLPNLYALTAGKTGQETTVLVAGEPMRAVLRQLRARFGWIFVSAACTDGGPEQIALGSAYDAVYLVLPEAEAEREAVDKLSQRLVRQGCCLRGYFLV